MSEATESDCEVSSSDDDLKIIGSKKVQANYDSESSEDVVAQEESKEPPKTTKSKEIKHKKAS